MTRVWLSEFTHKRLERFMQMKLPPVLTDSRGFKLVELPEETIRNVAKQFPGNTDSGINFAISHVERSNRLRSLEDRGSGPEAA